MNFDEFVEFVPLDRSNPYIYIRDIYSLRLVKRAIDLGGLEFDDKGDCKCSVLINPLNNVVAICQNPNGKFTIKKSRTNISLNSKSLIDHLLKLGYSEKKHYITTSTKKGVLLIDMNEVYSR